MVVCVVHYNLVNVEKFDGLVDVVFFSLKKNYLTIFRAIYKIVFKRYASIKYVEMLTNENTRILKKYNV